MYETAEKIERVILVGVSLADSDDAERSLACAKGAEKLYVGDLYLPPADGTGFVAATCLELRGLYADAMVEGSRSALALGHDRTAVRMAENAPPNMLA